MLVKGWRFEIFAKPPSLPANQSGGSSALSEHPADDDRCRRPLAVPDPISNRRHATSSGVRYVEVRPRHLRRSPSTTIGAPKPNCRHWRDPWLKRRGIAPNNCFSARRQLRMSPALCDASGMLTPTCWFACLDTRTNTRPRAASSAFRCIFALVPWMPLGPWLSIAPKSFPYCQRHTSNERFVRSEKRPEGNYAPFLVG